MKARIVPRLLGIVPVSWRRAIIGSGDHPSRFANLVHRLLNRIPIGEDEVFECKGDLQGYRMHTEWQKFRGLVYGNWEPDVSEVVSANVRPGMTVMDIGGHIGYYTLLLAKYVGEKGRVFVFEPLPTNFQLLLKNVQLNSLGQVEAVPCAVYSKDGEVTIAIPSGPPNSGESSIIYAVGSKQLQVRAITIDCFCRERRVRPEFLKVDVEGAEYEVLIGAEETVRGSRPKMLIELHHFDGNVEANRVPNLLERWGYRLEWIERSRQTSHILASPNQ